MDERFVYRGTLLQLFEPYALLVGALVVALFAMHGSIYVYLKTEGELQARAHRWIWRTFGVFLILYMLTTIATLKLVPHASANFERYPLFWGIVVLNILAIANIPRAIYQNRPGYAFVSSSATIAALSFLYGAALFPNLIIARDVPANSLTIFNASSSAGTLQLMQYIAFIGAPLVFTYTAIIYWVFRGKVKLDKHSY